MAVTQRFVLKRPNPNMPGEWACADCEAVMTATAAGTEPAQAVQMTHGEYCREVNREVGPGAVPPA